MKLSDKMKRSRFVPHQSKMILVHDFRAILVEEAVEVAEYCSSTIGNMPQESVLAMTLMDQSSALFSEELIGKFCDVMVKNRDKVRASAFVCPGGRVRNLFQQAAAAAGRSNVGFFESEAAAKEWLVNYGRGGL